MPCSQRVRVTYDKDKNPKKYELICEGKCADGKDCKSNLRPMIKRM
jgi:hypothetical protein